MFEWRKIVTRFLVATVLICLAAYIRRPFSDSNLFWMLVGFLLVTALLNLKYLVYEALVRFSSKKIKNFKLYPLFWVGYGLTVLVDMGFAYHASSGEADAGFGYLGLLVFTPWILLASYGLMLGLTHLKRKRA